QAAGLRLGIEVPFLRLEREERGRPRSWRIRRVARGSVAVLRPARTRRDDCRSVAGPRQRLRLSPPQPRRTAPYPRATASAVASLQRDQERATLPGKWRPRVCRRLRGGTRILRRRTTSKPCLLHGDNTGR